VIPGANEAHGRPRPGAYRLHTVGTLVQGLVAIAALWVIAAAVL
jgi:hypothetical protein